jgi:hypothetical protein
MMKNQIQSFCRSPFCNFTSAGLGLGLLLSLAASAQAETVQIKYAVSLSVLPIGSAYLTGTVNPDTYKVEAGMKLTGLASLVASARGVATASGAISGTHPVALTYATTASNSKMSRTIRMAMNGGSVSALDISPPFDEMPDRIPITAAQKHNIVDPLGAVVMPFSGNTIDASACDRTLPVFDGGARFDVGMSYTGTRNVKTKGYAGPVAICAVRYTPIAGHRPDRPATKFMEENRDMEVWLAPVGTTHVAVPYRISIKTMTGVAVIEASEFNISR